MKKSGCVDATPRIIKATTIHRYSAALSALLLCCACSTEVGTQAQKGVTERYSRFSENVFSFDYPQTWRRLTDADLQSFKKEYEAQSKQMFEDYHGPNVKDETGVPYMFVLSAPRMEALLVGAVMNMPPQKKSYLDEMYDRSKDVIQYGIRRGIVSKLIENKKDFSHGVPALKTDLEMGDGKRMTGYSFYSADHPNQVVYFVVRCKLEVCSKYDEDLTHVMNSLKIEFNRRGQ